MFVWNYCTDSFLWLLKHFFTKNVKIIYQLQIVFANISVSESSNAKISLDEGIQYPLVANFTYSVKWTSVSLVAEMLHASSYVYKYKRICLFRMKREERLKKAKESSFFSNNLEVDVFGQLIIELYLFKICDDVIIIIGN